MGIEKDIKVTVVFAVYNAEKYLCQALDSILAQTLTDIEIICVDDMSTDQSADILWQYERKEERIQVLSNTVKSDGAASARNLGISHAKGRYILVLDADDFFEKDMLEKAFGAAEKSGSDIVIFDGWIFDEKIQADLKTGIMVDRRCIDETDLVFSPKRWKRNIFQLTLGAAWNCLFSRELIERYGLKFQPYHHADDLGFVYLGFACAESMIVINQRLIHYRRNVSTSQGENAGRWPDAYYLSMRSLKQELEKRGKYETFSVSFAQAAMRYAVFYLNKMKLPETFYEFYMELRERDLVEFGVMDLQDEEFLDAQWAFMRNLIREYNPYEFVFRKLYRLAPFANGELNWKKTIPTGSKVAVYGAGVYGKRIVTSIIHDGNYRLSLWVDQKYSEIGYPVRSPRELFESDFDSILVAVISEDIWKGIQQYLISGNISVGKIVWIGDCI